MSSGDDGRNIVFKRRSRPASRGDKRVTIRRTNRPLFSKNEQARLATEVTPSDITEKYTLEFSSSKPDVASVDNQGNIKGLKAGQTVITLSVKEKPSVKDEFTSYCQRRLQGPGQHRFRIGGLFPRITGTSRQRPYLTPRSKG